MPVNFQTEISNAKTWTDAGVTININLTYEHGVIAALEWVTGATSTLPIQGRYDGNGPSFNQPVNPAVDAPVNSRL